MKLIDYVARERGVTRAEARKFLETIEDWALDKGAALGIQGRRDEAREYRTVARVLDLENAATV